MCKELETRVWSYLYFQHPREWQLTKDENAKERLYTFEEIYDVFDVYDVSYEFELLRSIVTRVGSFFSGGDAQETTEHITNKY